ncbi:MAG TPA: DUF2007 domain-containing protein [Anaerolineales bacterium]|nr:DUF2007 domain-containing protein [Anaerolineales bacterium]
MPDDLIVVYTATGQIEASLIKGLLESSGIPVMSVQEGAGAAYGFTVGLLGEVKLLVPEKYEAEAREVLATMNSESSGGPATDTIE